MQRRNFIVVGLMAIAALFYRPQPVIGAPKNPQQIFLPFIAKSPALPIQTIAQGASVSQEWLDLIVTRVNELSGTQGANTK